MYQHMGFPGNVPPEWINPTMLSAIAHAILNLWNALPVIVTKTDARHFNSMPLHTSKHGIW